MLIPEVILYNTIDKFLSILSDDFVEAGEPCSMLYSMFHDDDNGNRIVYSTYDWYVQAKDLLLRNIEAIRRLEVNIGYNLKRAGLPNIHILLPSESKGSFDSIGLSETSPYVKPTCGEKKLWVKKKTSHSCTYHLMITSDNPNEVLIVYYFLKYMFTALHSHFGLAGLINLTFSGQDVNVQQDLVPANIYHRNFSVQFSYENVVEVPIAATLIEKLGFKVCEDLKVDNEAYHAR